MALEKPMFAEAWQRWQPTAVKPWNRKWAAHLYRRAAFGASREELLEAERLGFDSTVELRPRNCSRHCWTRAVLPHPKTIAEYSSAAGGSTA